MKLYIISNRLPVKAVHRDGAYLFTRSEGGLATGLHALHTRYEKHWIGWPGVDVETDEDRRSIREELAKMNFHPIFLTPEQIANYYEGYSNSTIWPLCHYFFAFTRYRKDFWEAYRKVNALFCEVNPIPVKKAVELMGLAGGTVRLPMTEIEPQNAERLAGAMREYGLLD